MTTTLRLTQSALPAPRTILSVTLLNRPYLIASSNDSIHLLDESATSLISSISFKDAFPILPDSEHGEIISCIAVDESEQRIVATVGNKLAIFEPPLSRSTRWRVHSSFTTSNLYSGTIQAIDYKQNLIVLQVGKQIVLYSLRQDYALPSWKQIGILPFSMTISHLRISTDCQILAVLPKNSSTCLIYDLITNQEEVELNLRSRTVHSIKLKSIDWRSPNSESNTQDTTTTTPSDSGPILMTTTIQNTIHLWGCVIDEPKQFSLWISIPSPPPPTPTPTTTSATTRIGGGGGGGGRSPLVPLDQNSTTTTTKKKNNNNKNKLAKKNKRLKRIVWTGYWRTRKTTTSSSREDLFISLLETGEFLSTVVSNLDSRPPTCLTSQTTTTTFVNSITDTIPRSELGYFRQTVLLKSRSQPNSTLHLISLSSWSGLLHTQLSTSSLNEREEMLVPRSRMMNKPGINFVGRVRKLIKSFPFGENCLVLGDTTDSERVRLQSWEELIDGVMSSKEESVIDLRREDDDGEKGKKRVASWFGGRRVIVGEKDQLTIYERGGEEEARMKVFTSHKVEGIDFDFAKCFQVVRRSEDDLQTWIIAVTKKVRPTTTTTTTREYDYSLNTWIYYSPSRQIFTGAPSKPLNPATSTNGSTIVWVSIVPPGTTDSIDRIELQSVDSQGFVTTFRLDLNDQEQPHWSRVSCFETGVTTGLVTRSSSKGNGIIALASSTSRELTIWNEKNSKFGNPLEFVYSFDKGEGETVVSLEFSIDTNYLALATRTKVIVFTTTSNLTRWKQIAVINPKTRSFITNLQFHSKGIVVACQEELFFHSFKLIINENERERGRNLETTVVEQSEERESLSLISLESLEKLIQFGQFETVLKILKLSSQELDQDGTVIERIGTSDVVKFGIEEILNDFENRRTDDDERNHDLDVVASIQTRAERALREKAAAVDTEKKLTELDRSKLLIALEKGNSLKRVSKRGHFELRNLVERVYKVQSKLNSIDSFGIRYLSSIDPSSSSSVDSRDMLFAFHSTSQEALVDECIMRGGGKLSWEQAQKFGIPLWLSKNFSLFYKTLELIGRTSFLINPEERDPILPMLFYLALGGPKRKRFSQIITFWKQSLGHSDQRQMLKFLSNDFELERWRLAAKKNAFVLLSKRRFLFASCFFLLGDSLEDCVMIIMKHLKDPLLAVAIARVYENQQEEEGDDFDSTDVIVETGPVLKRVLENTILLEALSKGDRFTANWTFEMLGLKELSLKVLIESLPLITEFRGLFKIETVLNPLIEDPCRIVFVQHLLSNIETRGKTTTTTTTTTRRFVDEKSEFEFVLYISRLLYESGFNILALDLLRSYKFLPPPRVSTVVIERDTRRKKEEEEPSQFIEPPTSNLFDMQTREEVAVVLDQKEDEEEETEEETQKRLFLEISGIGKKKIESKPTVEAFSFDAFGF